MSSNNPEGRQNKIYVEVAWLHASRISVFCSAAYSFHSQVQNQDL